MTLQTHVINHKNTACKITISALLLLILFALWTSIHQCFAIWNINADTVDMALLFHGLQVHGIKFLTTWRYTEDNWLLSVGPLSYVIYYLFGVNNFTIIFPGWIILVFNALVGGYILLRLVRKQSIYPSLIFLLVCLFTSLGSIGVAGFMAFLMSHNSTMSIVLVSLLCLLEATQKSETSFINIWMLLLLYSVFIGGISDPWFNAAFTLPAILSLTLLALSIKNKSGIYISLIYTAIGLILSQTKLFGILDFLPSTNYVFVTSTKQFYQNIYFFAASLLTFTNAHELLRMDRPLGYAYIAGVTYIAASALYIITSIKHKFKAAAESLFIYFSAWSIVVMTAAFVFSDFPDGYYSARYLVNIFYLSFMVIIYAYYKNYDGKFYKFIIPLLLLSLYLYSSAYQGVQYWKSIPLNHNNSSSTSLINFLGDHDLHYGYGGYWASDANAISVISGYHTIIRPVSYEPVYKKGNNVNFPFAYIVGNHGQSSPFWYHKSDTKTYHTSFLVISDGGGAPELYNNSIKSSEKIAATGQFGTPSKIYDFDKKKILVWDKAINVSVYGERSARYNRVIRSLIYAYKCVLEKNSRINPYPLLAENYGCLRSYYGGFDKNKPNFNWTANGPSAWLGYQGANKIGVGINVNFKNSAQVNKYLNHIFDKYGKSAKIYFPYPREASGQSNTRKTNGFLMIEFDK
ncbi:hypothetical protein [Acidithiobacillus ferridurans]|uniref:hypothetical protein n=1 Tax=Acidithiobacillus ferridurans TaxID=1232575 RepID=UPI001C07DC1A|nr:hypothetical protein [Acidithiobacillus ferridurans]MBU2731609.1 hypothetical protein [Acidithiobacillus ferridurans]